MDSCTESYTLLKIRQVFSPIVELFTQPQLLKAQKNHPYGQAPAFWHKNISYKAIKKLPLFHAEVSIVDGSGEGTRTPDTAGMNRML